jgi:hypothetical protein
MIPRQPIVADWRLKTQGSGRIVAVARVSLSGATGQERGQSAKFEGVIRRKDSLKISALIRYSAETGKKL